MLEIVCVPIIMAVVYTVVELYKKATSAKPVLAKFIPIIACVLGVIVGVVCFYCCPNIIAARNLLGAMIIGGASGLSATGCNQIFKQLKQFGVVVKSSNATPAKEEDLKTENESLTDKTNKT